MFETFLSSLGDVLAPGTFVLLVGGVLIGFAVGILPGLGGATAVALLLPFTFEMQPVETFAFLLGVLVVTATTGDITSVVFGVPGEATSAAAVLDGHPMTRRGEGGRALGAVLLSSLFGAFLGAFTLALAVPVIRPLILFFGPAELFILALVGLTFVVTLSGGDVARGLIMACLGLLVAMVGIDPQDGVPRYTFDQLYLWDGIPLVPLVIGLFGGAEVLQLLLSRSSIVPDQFQGVSPYTGLRQGARDVLANWTLVLRSSAIGTGLGMIPGVGGSVSQFVAYGYAKQVSKHPEEFGRGSIEGVIAAGANNNAKDGGSLIPTVAFGIPGGVASAVLLGAFLIAGLNPGPEMLTDHVDIVFSMVWIVVIANTIAVIVALALLKPVVKLTTIPGHYLVPLLLILLGLGAYSTSNNFTDVIVMLVAAVIGVACILLGWPRVPFLLAVVLGPLAERYLFLANSLYGDGWVTRPGVLALVGIAFLAAILPRVLRRVRSRGNSEIATDHDLEVL